MIESPDLIARLQDLVENGGKFLGVFDRSVIPKSRAVELLEMLFESLPVEIEQAKEIVENREEILDDAKRQAGDIVDDAVRQAEKLVDADEITVMARRRAMEIGAEADDYVRRKLEDFEKKLEGLLEEVRTGIRSLGKR
ncbi:MAG TPA: hypothetical protein ENN67_07280 [Firmicutes bacterium]|nr:hypothetical protein [Bacillota bacterium]